ncbi:hypothetical protein B0A50_06175 [Salinomyces thailandicus]|uniref:DNA-directed RNA polymerase II subunit RPB9-like zinc ribbon domain-containing protein n=1 Tax=Salinomyces thailandicus TaxID=706561 RepID=A0A4U0TSG8_9PEZI|nr:hypothetical protein B0A50_06175 [Salinomyces thailandica]
MASYDIGSPAAKEQVKDDSKKISFRFCRECSNMLYPKEDKLNNQLMFACRMCQWAEPADATCIYRNALKEEIAETAGNVEDVAQDPTVGDDFDLYVDDFEGDDEDIYGNGSGYVYHGHEANDNDDDDEMDTSGEDTLPETCTLCGKQILCPFCHKPSSNGLTLETTDPASTTAGNPQKEAEQVQAEQRERSKSGAGAMQG